MTYSWVQRAAHLQLKKHVEAIREAAYTYADVVDREVSMDEMIAAALRETINQCQNGNGIIFSHDLYAIADCLAAHTPESDND